MSQTLPTNRFELIWKIKELITKKIAELVKRNKHGHTLELDVDYPEELHNIRNKLRSS